MYSICVTVDAVWIEVLTPNVRVNVYPMNETTVPTASSPCVGENLKNKNQEKKGKGKGAKV